MFNKYLPAIAAVLAVASVWSLDRNAQYKAGAVACEQRRAQDVLQSLPEALEKADRTREEVEKAKDEHETFKDTIASLDTSSAGFTDDELWVFNKAIEAANARSSSGSGEVRQPSLSN